MKIYTLISELIKNPNAPKFYREMLEFYQKHNLVYEASAIQELIEQKFHDNSSNSDKK